MCIKNHHSGPIVGDKRVGFIDHGSIGSHTFAVEVYGYTSEQTIHHLNGQQ